MATTTAAADEPLWVTQLRQHIGMAVKMAAAGKEPRGLAGSLHDYFLNDQSKGLLRELVAQENAEQQLLEAFPPLAPYATWTAEFIDELRVIFGLVVDEDTTYPGPTS